MMCGLLGLVLISSEAEELHSLSTFATRYQAVNSDEDTRSRSSFLGSPLLFTRIVAFIGRITRRSCE
jgi:hypothetical protein